MSAEWLLELNRKSAEQFLLSKGVTETEIGNLDDMGFTPEEIRTIFQAVETEEDKALLQGLMKGDYDAAFQTNATMISSDIQMFLSEYFMRLSMSDQEEGLKTFESAMNALLKPRRDETYYGVAGYIESNSNARKYLEILYAGTTNILDLESLLLYAPEALTEGQYQELLQRNENLFALSTLYGSQYEIVNQILDAGNPWSNSIEDMSQLSIRGLQYNENTNTYSYTIQYEGMKRFYGLAGETTMELMEGNMFVSTAILETPNQMSSQMMQEAYRGLQEAQRKLGGKLFTDLTTGGSTLYLTSIHPLLGAAAALASGLSGGSLGTAYDTGVKGVKASKFMDQELVNRVFSNVNVAIPGVAIKAAQNYAKKSQELEEQSQWMKEYFRMSWFGSGGTYRVDGGEAKLVAAGIYNPDVIEKMRVWQEGGLDKLIQKCGLGLKRLSEDEKLIFEKKLDDDELQLWLGKGIFEMDSQQLDDAANRLAERYQEETKKKIDIKNLLNTR